MKPRRSVRRRWQQGQRGVAVTCDDGNTCGGAIPHTFRVSASFRFNDIGLGLVDQWSTSRHEWAVSGRSSAAYGVVSESGSLGDPP